MGIIKNNKNIIAIYRGDKKITSVFKNNLKIFEINDEPVVFDNIINSKLQTTSANQTKTLTSKQEYFDSIIVDGETELVSGGTGSLSYKFPDVGTHTVKYKVKDNITDISKIFSNSYYTTEIDANSLDTSNVTNMSESFRYCNDLISLKLSNWNTSKVTNMANMFQGCYDLTSLDVSNFDTSNVTDMSQMFTDLQKITSLDLSNFNTSKVTNMKWLFSGCEKLTNLNLKDWDTSNVTNMEWMFRSNSSLTSLDITSFRTPNVTNMSSMFDGCSKITTIHLLNFDTSKVTDMSDMFFGCEELQSLDIYNFNTSKVETFSRMFFRCEKLTSLDLGTFNTSNVKDFSSMFTLCSSLTSLSLDKFDISNASSYSSMFVASNNLNYIKCTQTFKNWCLVNQSEISLPNAMKEGGSGTWDIYSNAKTTFALGNTLLTSKKEYFSSIKNASKSEELDVSGTGELSTSIIGYTDIKYTFKEGLTDLISCFANCSKLDSIDLSDVSFASINDISGLFEGCTSIKTISFKNEDLSHISNYTNAFANCNSLSKIICTEETMNWLKSHSDEIGLNDTMKNGTVGLYGRKTNWELYSYDPVTTTGQTFIFYSNSVGEEIKITQRQECFNKIFVDGVLLDNSGTEALYYTSRGNGDTNGKFDLNLIESYIFQGCDKLKEIDLSGFNGNYNSFEGLFSQCNSLEKLYLPSSLTDISQYSVYSLFDMCYNLRTIRCNKAVKDYLVSNSSSVNLPIELEYGSEGGIDSGSNWELYDY